MERQDLAHCATSRPCVGALIFAWPILPGKSEAWRRFIQEVQGSRHGSHAESRRRLGITRELVGLTHLASGDVAMIYLESPNPAQTLAQLVASGISFDVWFRKRLHEIQGLDLGEQPFELLSDVVFVWQDDTSPRP